MDSEVRNHQDDLFCVFWMSGPTVVNALVQAPREGGSPRAVRCYPKGQLDQRAGEESKMPRFTDKDYAMEWMLNNDGEKCLISVRAAKQMREGGDHFSLASVMWSGKS
jgi:hypothetical protein